MDTLQCAIVLAKLGVFEREFELRQQVAARYDALLRETRCPAVSDTLVVRPDRDSAFAQYTIMVKDRDRVQEGLRESGVPTAVHYPVPLNEQPAYAHLCCPDCTPVSQAVSKRVVSLPMHPYLAGADQERIIGAVSRLDIA
jgi:UDP-2-acetamido-2-deoxy-ribo-hexuluronate aminotransferase